MSGERFPAAAENSGEPGRSDDSGAPPGDTADGYARGVATWVAEPNLALVKYWGKRSVGTMLPATPSLGVTLGGLRSLTRCAIRGDGEDEVVLDGVAQDPARFVSFFDCLRSWIASRRGVVGPGTPVDFSFPRDAGGRPGEYDPGSAGRRLAVDLAGGVGRFSVRSRNDFPTAAGLASSSSGFAAMAAACVDAAGLPVEASEISALARGGSVSAARAAFGGFVGLDAGAERAVPLYQADWWPELRVLIVVVRRGPKELGSREAMERCARTSPFHSAWVASAGEEYRIALDALGRRDLEALGEASRRSYLRMFGSMLAADPPVLFWAGATVDAIRICAELRASGLPAWETVDAGPQVKVLTIEPCLRQIREALAERLKDVEFLVARPGAGPHRVPE